jgi:hypothetical protein
MERGDDPSPNYVLIHQTLDHLVEGVDLLLVAGNGSIAPVHRCFFEEMTSVRRQGRVCRSVRRRPPGAKMVISLSSELRFR